MKNTLKLKNPIMVNNAQVAEVAYDADEITALLFAEAEARRKTAAGSKNVVITPAAEFDFGLHLYLGFAAILAVNPALDFSDVERIHGADLVKVMQIGRDFLLKSDGSAENNSDEQSETTPEPSTQAPKTSEKKE